MTILSIITLCNENILLKLMLMLLKIATLTYDFSLPKKFQITLYQVGQFVRQRYIWYIGGKVKILEGLTLDELSL